MKNFICVLKRSAKKHGLKLTVISCSLKKEITSNDFKGCTNIFKQIKL